MEVTCSLKRFRPWGEAVAVFDRIEMANKLGELEDYLETLYGKTMDGLTLNDLLAYDNEDLLAAIGLANEEEEDIDESFAAKLNKQICEAINEGQYDYPYEEEEDYTVELEDGQKLFAHQYDYELEDDDMNIFAKLENSTDWNEIAQAICKWVEEKNLPAVVRISDLMGQVIYEA